MPLKATVDLKRGNISIGLLPELGGRMVSLALKDEELLFMPEDGLMPPAPVLMDVDAYKKAHGFKVYGGDKTWVAPEKEWGMGIPSVDLDAGEYAFVHEEGSCVMTSPVCRETGLQITRHVGFLEKGDIFLTETLFNAGTHTLSRGIWNVTQIKRPFEVFVKADERGVRSYHLENSTLPDPGFSPTFHDGWAMIPCQANTCFKFGAQLTEGRVALLKDTPFGKLVWARIFDIDLNSPYAHGSMAEVFNAPWDLYAEVEVHSPLALLAPGEKVSLTQLWRLYFMP